MHSLIGALVMLGRVANWEKVGTAEPQEVADAFRSAYDLTIEGGSCMPTGSIIWFAGGTVPNGYLVCDGAQYNTADYPRLFDALGYAWGGSGGVFNVPNLAGEFVRASGGGVALGDTGGQESVTLGVSEMPAHTHTMHSHLTSLAVEPGELPVSIPSVVSGLTGSTGGGQAHENMPPFVVLTAIIKT